ncbi:class II aldolase/adducin family protein [Nocardioides limicola]|uniref:class II aldolase/adducin family protein n=1 Tax=Nocardioides limicola TaxID=2803368 RepID=UPI00193B8977|nr:class II aldolase/adducin family protein [Nocardioides sp. DJM-14]
MSTFDEERSAIAMACRRLAEAGLVIGTAGNVSVRIDDRVAITATGARFEELTATDVSIVDLDGDHVWGELQPTSELDLHLGIYRRFGSTAVVHTHSPVATAVGLVVDELPCVHYQMLLLGGAVRVAPYATFGTPELATAVAAALEGRSAALMANHGAVTHAGSLQAAVDQALLLEWACTLYWRAASMGSPRHLSAAEQEQVVVQATARHYGSTRPARTEENR